ncbi:MAG: hypothetical protein GW942_02420 [Candidatus Pacebacteria bacterium]|nr:hypothetical protein [Candidatus Paceibacterota bacterium]
MNEIFKIPETKDRNEEIKNLREIILNTRDSNKTKQKINPDTVLSNKKYDIGSEPEEVKKRLELAKEYTSSLDLIAICYHGIGRSAQVINDIVNFPSKKKIKGKNYGFQEQIFGLISSYKSAKKFFYSKELPDNIVVFLGELADVLTEPDKILLFDSRSSMKNILEKTLYDLVVKKAGEKKRKIYDFSKDYTKAYPEVFKDLGLT